MCVPVRVVLTGFMGAGKSTVGALLAKLLGWSFSDVDAVIEQEQGSTVPALFSAHGEAHFRALEERAVERLLVQERAVIALGGGALESPSTRERLQSTPGTRVIFLYAPLALLVARCQGQSGAAQRPVLQQAADLERRHAARLPLYRQAHQTIDTEGRTPEQIAREIAATLAFERT